MPAQSPLASSLRRKRSPLAGLLSELATVEGFGPTCLPDVRLMRSSETHPSSPVSYDPSIVIIAQGRKRGRLGARNYLALAVPLPFECETFGTPEEPMLGMAVRVNPATVATRCDCRHAAYARDERRRSSSGEMSALPG
jgi:AraC-type transcriptional regulator N-terminus